MGEAAGEEEEGTRAEAVIEGSKSPGVGCREEEEEDLVMIGGS